MSFWTFVLYLLGATAVLYVAWNALLLAVIVVVKVTMAISDKAGSVKANSTKWARKESELDE